MNLTLEGFPHPAQEKNLVYRFEIFILKMKTCYNDALKWLLELSGILSTFTSMTPTVGFWGGRSLWKQEVLHGLSLGRGEGAAEAQRSRVSLGPQFPAPVWAVLCSRAHPEWHVTCNTASAIFVTVSNKKITKPQLILLDLCNEILV